MKLEICSMESPFELLKSNGDYMTATKMRKHLATLSFGDITGFKTSVLL